MNFEKTKDTYNLVKSLYKDSFGRPFSMTPTQNKIFDCIFNKRGINRERRVWVASFTQFGKSDIVSMAVLTRAATYAEKWCIVAPSQSKARIIISYLISHVFDNEFTISRFKIKEGENTDRVRRERSKNRLTFDCGNNKLGEVFVLSADSRLKNIDDIGNSLMGFSAAQLVLDEAALIEDAAEAKAMRMVGGFTGSGEDFVVKIGNPFKRNHFLTAFRDKNYYKINADFNVGVSEKNEYGEQRLTKEFVEEMRAKPSFKVLYENKFPEENEIDLQGWIQLLSEDDVQRAMVKEDEEIDHAGERRIGNDVARGGANKTIWVLRSMNYAEIIAKSAQNNLTEIAGQTLRFMQDKGVTPENVFIDSVGVGGGAVDPLHYQQKNVRGVNFANSALEVSKYSNLRAEAYWNLRMWIKQGGRLNKDDDWYQLCDMKYKVDSKGRLRMMSKDDLRIRGVDSPDVADALALTFARREHGEIEKRKKMKEARRRKHSFGRGLQVSMGGY